MQSTGYKSIKSGYETLSAEALPALLKPASTERIATGIKNRISLAGAQSKISLYRTDDETAHSASGWELPHGLAASTHILKPQSQQFENLVENEIFCMRLAQTCGIEVAQTSVIQLDDPVLAVKRFDRFRDDKGVVVRLPQEDICQILSINPLYKYETDGGPGYEDVRTALMRWSTNGLADVQEFLKRALFNYLIGNCDAHGKNYSISISLDGEKRLAPAYDLVSTTFYPGVSLDMAMKMGEHYNREQIDDADFSLLARQLGVGERVLISCFATLVDTINVRAELVARDLVDAGLLGVEAIEKHIVREVKAHAGVLSILS